MHTHTHWMEDTVVYSCEQNQQFSILDRHALNTMEHSHKILIEILRLIRSSLFIPTKLAQKYQNRDR